MLKRLTIINVLSLFTRRGVSERKTLMCTRKWLVLMIVLPLVFGALLYYFFCPDVFFVLLIDRITGLEVHAPDRIARLSFVRILRNYLMDCIWAFSFANTFFLIIKEKQIWRVVIVMMPILAGICLEIFQRLGIISGTFDVIDIIVEAAGATLAFIIIRVKSRRHCDEKAF